MPLHRRGGWLFPFIRSTFGLGFDYNSPSDFLQKPRQFLNPSPGHKRKLLLPKYGQFQISDQE